MEDEGVRQELATVKADLESFKSENPDWKTKEVAMSVVAALSQLISALTNRLNLVEGKLAISRWEVFRNLLAQGGIQRPRDEVMTRIKLHHYNGIDGATETVNSAVEFYRMVSNIPSTSTKRKLEAVLHVSVEGPFKTSQPNILTAVTKTNEQKIIKLLRVQSDGSSFEIQRQELTCEIRACNILSAQATQHALVPCEIVKVEYDNQPYHAILMPRYLSTLFSNPRCWEEGILMQGPRMMNAVEYMHSNNLVHMDIRDANIFIDINGDWFLGDFGSTKLINEPITTTSLFMFSRENVIGQPAVPRYDWFMLLLVLVKEALRVNHSSWIPFLCDEDEKYDSSKILSCISSPEFPLSRTESKEMLTDIFRRSMA